MLISYKRGQGSIVVRFKILNNAVTTGAGKTGLTEATAGMIIGTIADNEATTTRYRTSSSEIETISTLGTYAAPSSSKCRFKEVDATNHPGVYEAHFADARYAVTNAKSMLVSISGGTGVADTDFLIPLRDVDPYDPIRAGLTSLPAAAAEAAGGLFTRGTGAGQINQEDSGYISVNLKAILRTVLTETTGGWIAAAFKKLFDVATPVLTGESVNQTGDSFNRIGATGSGLTSLAPSATALSTVQWTNARASYLDNANVGGALASQADVLAINQSASRRVILTTVGQYERPEASSTVYTVEARTYSDDGVPMDATGTPTLAATGQTSGDLAANLGIITNPATGLYRWTYTVASNATIEPIRFDFSAVVDGDTVTLSVYTQVADFIATTFTTQDRTDLQAALADTNELQIDWVNGGRLDVILDARASQTTADAIEADTQNIQTRIPTALTASGKMNSRDVVITGSVVDVTPAASNFDTDLTGPIETWQDLILVFTSGTQINRSRPIATYDPTNGHLTFDETFTGVPANGDTFELVLAHVHAVTTLQDGLATEAKQDTAQDDITEIQKVVEADAYIDTGVTPWDLVLMERGTGGIGVGVELLRKNLKDVSGTDITNTTTVIGQAAQ